MKNLIKNADVLNKEEQKGINGGFGPQPGKVICLAPYFIPDHTVPCLPGYHLHPAGICVCCKD
jgi:hypothetical protein